MVAGGHNNTEKDKKVFFNFQLKNWRIPVEVFVTSFVRFVNEDDKSKPDIIKDSFDSGA
jgi:hypothetical protein